MKHVVFNEADIDILKKAIELDEGLAGEIIWISDKYEIGPIYAEYNSEKYQERKNWWQKVLEGGDFENQIDFLDNDRKVFVEIENYLKDNSENCIWIWAAQNKHDVCGYYWLISQLKDYQGQVIILYLNNLPFINEKGGIFFPTYLAEIAPKEFLKAQKLARPITTSEFEVDADEWSKLANENKMVRLLEGGKKIIQADEDYFDQSLRQYVMPTPAKASRVIQNFINKAKENTSEAYALWRLKNLIAAEKISATGKIACMKDFEVSTKQSSYG